MYEIKCMYTNGAIDTLNRAESVAKAKELISIYRKRHVFYLGKEAIEFWYQKPNADIPDYIRRIGERIYDIMYS